MDLNNVSNISDGKSSSKMEKNKVKIFKTCTEKQQKFWNNHNVNNQAVTGVFYKAVTSAQTKINRSKQLSFPNKSSSGISFVHKPWPQKLLAGQHGSIDPDLECQYCKNTGHHNDSCVRLACILAWDRCMDQNVSRPTPGKWELLLNQRWFKDREDKYSLNPGCDEWGQELKCMQTTPVMLQRKYKIMQWVVAKCPSVCVSVMEKLLQSL